jgi:hypothetical protein
VNFDDFAAMYPFRGFRRVALLPDGGNGKSIEALRHAW